MLSTLEEIRQRIIEIYNPDRIILFGSCAEHGESAAQDIDLLVIKETDKNLLERQIELEQIISDRMRPVDVLVYTPSEVRKLFSLGSPF